MHLYRTPGLSTAHKRSLLHELRQVGLSDIEDIESEFCFNIYPDELSEEKLGTLAWLLRETFEQAQFGRTTFLEGNGNVLEVGPRMNFSTAWSTNAVSICHACGLHEIRRIERSRRYLIKMRGPFGDEQRHAFLEKVHDRMTECHYPEPLVTFETGVQPEATVEIPVVSEGRAALERVNREMGLAFDDWDLDYYTNLFVDKIGRNLTNVECFDIAQSNSEHSRHWFFKGRLIIDGEEMSDHLIAMISDTLKANPGNSIIAFRDNSSSIRGFPIKTIVPSQVGEASAFVASDLVHHHRRGSPALRSWPRRARRSP